MSDDKSELAKQAQELGKSKASDHVANIVKATLNAVPILGGSIASLIDDYIPESRQKRIEEFSKSLAEEMERLADSLDETYVKTDEFAYLFTRVYQDVTRDYQQEKLVAYRNMLVNSLRADRNSVEHEWSLTLLEQMTPLHIITLAVFESNARNSRKFHLSNRTVSFHRQVERLTNLTWDIAFAVIQDLNRFGLLDTSGITYSSRITGLEKFLTPMGRKFLNFIGSDKDDETRESSG